MLPPAIRADQFQPAHRGNVQRAGLAAVRFCREQEGLGEPVGSTSGQIGAAYYGWREVVLILRRARRFHLRIGAYAVRLRYTAGRSVRRFEWLERQRDAARMRHG